MNPEMTHIILLSLLGLGILLSACNMGALVAVVVGYLGLISLILGWGVLLVNRCPLPVIPDFNDPKNINPIFIW